MAAEVITRAISSRTLPQPIPANVRDGSPTRSGLYGEPYVQTAGKRIYTNIDEGFYFVTNNNAQSGILSSAATGFVNTTPACIIYNGDSTGGKRCYLDFLKLVTTVVGSAASGLVRVAGAIYIDTTNRYSSGGTEITANIVNPNMDVAKSTSVARVWFGALTASAPTGAVRAVDPYFIPRLVVSGTVVDVVGEQKMILFGTVEGVMNGSITVANANNIPIPEPGVVIGPNQSCLIYLWQETGATNVAATYQPTLAWYER